jgi:hypothetical protein
MTVSLTLGFLFLPNTAVATPVSTTAVPIIGLQRPPGISTYVGDLSADTISPLNEIVIGMDVPKTAHAAQFELIVLYSNKDHMVDLKFSSSEKPVAHHVSSKELKDPKYQAEAISGTIKPGSRSYTEFHQGYLGVYAQGDILSTQRPTPNDAVKIGFVIKGPVQITHVAGASMSARLPAITLLSERAHAGQLSAPFTSEMIYNGGDYQDQTGGATIQGGTHWEWSSQGELNSLVVTGVDPAAQQSASNDLFLAAVLFGLSAASAAAFAVELVEAIQDHRRHRRAALALAALQGNGEPPPSDPDPPPSDLLVGGVGT